MKAYQLRDLLTLRRVLELPIQLCPAEAAAGRGTHSLDWHLLPPVADPSTAAAIAAAAAPPGTAEHTNMMTNTGDVGASTSSTQP